MASSISAIFKGVNEFNSVTKEIEGRVDRATLASMKTVQNKMKVAIRANLRGEPRWTQKGKNKITGANYQVPGTVGQHNRPRGGSPGRMTGTLYKGVGSVKKPKNVNGYFEGGVGIGAKPNNVKKRMLETKYPYFAPAIAKVEPQVVTIYQNAWAKATDRMGGII